MVLMWILSILVILLLIWYIDDKYISGKNLPPGPYRLPIIGTVSLIAAGLRKESPYVTFRAWKKKYGSVITSKFGVMWQIIVDDPVLIKELLSSDDWINRPENAFVQERSFGEQLGVLWGNGDPWKELRRFSIRTLRDFGFGKQMSQEVVMEEELKELMESLNQTIEDENNIVFMEKFFTVSVLNIIWSMVAGVRFSHKDKRMQKLVRKISNTLQIVSAGGNIFMAFPFLRHIMTKLGSKKLINRAETLAELQKDFQDILDERRKEGYYKQDQRDFVDVFLYEIDKHAKGAESEEVFTDRQFITTLIDLFVAGSDTTANTSEFAILYMLHNPDVQAKVQAEIDLVVGRNRLPNASDRAQLPYTDATIHEIQRMANIVPLIPRVATKDKILRGYKVRKGMTGVLNMYSYHHDPQIWDEPNKFNPNRFIDSNSKIVNTEKLHVFGGGKRICMGEILARATLFNYFATLLQNYTFEVSPQHPLPSPQDPLFGLTMSPRPYYAVVKRRAF